MITLMLMSKPTPSSATVHREVMAQSSEPPITGQTEAIDDIRFQVRDAAFRSGYKVALSSAGTSFCRAIDKA